ncbi:MAG: hypothetical protein CMQ40_12240 [Gammaproteobacteria bacterium]|nr:hypothetical protein [Gammaproteobacteria bacterium]
MHKTKMSDTPNYEELYNNKCDEFENLLKKLLEVQEENKKIKNIADIQSWHTDEVFEANARAEALEEERDFLAEELEEAEEIRLALIDDMDELRDEHSKRECELEADLECTREERDKAEEENKKGQEEYNRLMNSHVEYEKECHLLKEELKEAKEVATTIAGHAKFMEDVIEKMGEEICDDCKSKMTYQIVKPEDI